MYRRVSFSTKSGVRRWWAGTDCRGRAGGRYLRPIALLKPRILGTGSVSCC
jgi:hypothetical protein